MRSGAPQVSGRAFLGLIRYIKDSRGAAMLANVIQEAGDAARSVFGAPIRVTAWHPYDAFTAFLVAADKRLGRGDPRFCRELGDAAGRRDLNSIFRVYVALASAERLIRSCEKLWTSYYRNAGRMEAIRWRPDDTVLRIYDFSSMHPAHCRLMEGWMIATMAAIGFRVNDDALESECTSRGGPYHEFRCTWTRAR